jgi:hypothetical protein
LSPFCNNSPLPPLRFAAAIAAAAIAGFAATNGPDACGAYDAAPKLASPCQHYSLKLGSLYIPPSQPMGLLVKARIDGGPPLRFLLDSGARDIVLDKRAAALLKRSAGTGLELVGMGPASKTAKRAAPGEVQIGDLVLRDCPILAVDGKLMEGVDGVMPMSLFAGFLLRLDVPGKSLELDPYLPGPPLADEAFAPVRADNRLLFLEAALNGSKPGYVLLDTGATYNGVSPAAARAWKNYRFQSPGISLYGSAGEIDGFLLPPGVQFRFGSHVLSADPAVVVDLSAMARHHNFEVSGVIGYPALRRSVVTIDYRDSLVRMEVK